MLGNLLPALLLAVAAVAAPAAGIVMALAGLLAIGGGWLAKYTLVRRAAFTQGFALKHLPVRGRGPAGAAVKPGWGGAS
jgi:phenylacetyl-CoA:acceptor oxidoreductase subunit 2